MKRSKPKYKSVIIICVVIATLCFVLGLTVSSTGKTVEKYKTGSVETDRVFKHIRINWNSGDVKVYLTRDDSISVNADDETNLLTEFDGDTLRVNNNPAEEYRINNLTVKIPQYLIFDDFDIETDGNINVDGLFCKDLTMRSYEKSIKAENFKAADSCIIDCMQGNVYLINSSSRRYDLKMTNGKCIADNVHWYKNFRIRNNEGNVQLTNCNNDNISLKSANAIFADDCNPYVSKNNRYVFGDGTGKMSYHTESGTFTLK